MILKYSVWCAVMVIKMCDTDVGATALEVVELVLSTNHKAILEFKASRQRLTSEAFQA